MPQCAPVERLRPGDHVCWTFEDDRARDDIVAAYVRGGVQENHKTLYFPHSATPEQSLASLAEAGIDVDGLTARGQLQVLGSADTYLSTGRFDSTRMIDTCAAACEEARAEGYPGVRMAGDAGWATEQVAGAEHLAEYEAAVNRVYAEGYAIGLCLYDRRLFAPGVLTDIRVQHPAAADAATDAAWEPLLRIRTLPGGAGLRLSGETDLSNRGSLVTMLDRLAPGPDGAPPILDVGALVFADVAAAHAMVLAAARVGRLRIVGASSQLARLLSFAGGGHVPGLTVQSSRRVRTSA